ncbi:MAG: hypothetical protein AB2814_07440 [Candidatus Sedimenticola endophacoides]
MTRRFVSCAPRRPQQECRYLVKDFGTSQSPANRLRSALHGG